MISFPHRIAMQRSMRLDVRVYGDGSRPVCTFFAAASSTLSTRRLISWFMALAEISLIAALKFESSLLIYDDILLQ